MSYFVGGAILVGAVVSAESSSKASKQQAKGVQKGIDASAALAQQARSDVMKLWQQGATQGRAGIEGAFDFYKQAAPKRMAPVNQGFQAGINVLGQGAQQANNAILGLPVDMGFTNQQTIQAPEGYLDGAKLVGAPVLGAEAMLTEQPTVVQDQSASGSTPGTREQIRTAGGLLSDPLSKDRYDPVKRLTNPLGLSEGVQKKLESKSVAKKVIKKLF